ncbi:KAT8 regulatory NSL complex subunit 1, partial [Eurytemora carolleeae]|uniref:KAT8 regulatory NSL complex subunit 1 n=1 Tax=Eurytemora carolleeae TaxID=1294199 RepID=UPI000C75A2D9
MDQLILNLGNIDNIGGLDGDVCQAEKEGEVQDNTDGLLDRSNQLSRDVDEVLSEALESSIEQQEHDTISSVESKLIRCQERQLALESRFRRMQERISKLRAIRVGQHAAEQIQLGVVSCEKRLSCQRGVVNERPRTEPAVQDLQGKETVKRRLKDGEPKIRRPKIRKYNKKKADETFGQLYGHLRHVQRFLDPEATESSSGGDSADEDEKYTPGAVLYAPIKERAKYRYLKKRCLYASQWGWLLCQISDLEFRIRQQNEMYRVYRDGKGAVTLDDSGATQSSHHGRKFTGATQGSDGIMRRPVEFDYNSEENSEDELTQTCSRVRPINRVKRRKLVDTYSLHETSSRAGKPSSVSCTCLVPTEWCILCLGRRNRKQTLDPYSYSRAESIALLDHSYHAVLP